MILRGNLDYNEPKVPQVCGSQTIQKLDDTVHLPSRQPDTIRQYHTLSGAAAHQTLSSPAAHYATWYRTQSRPGSAAVQCYEPSTKLCYDFMIHSTFNLRTQVSAFNGKIKILDLFSLSKHLDICVT